MEQKKTQSKLLTKFGKAFFLFSFLITNILTGNVVDASGPRFNFLPGDHEMFRGANLTKGEEDWRDPVFGNAGDVFGGLIYYHNGMENTIAKNTIIKVDIPSMTQNKTAKLTATISADNATAISDTLTVNLDTDTKIEFVPGSVRWFPDAEKTGRAVKPLPGGQTGDEIVKGGINIGDIQGCWEFAGFVSFKFKTIKTEEKTEMAKIAKNLTTGEEGTSISAKPCEEVLYTLTTKNLGTEDKKIIVKDDISDILKSAEIINISDDGKIEDGFIVYPEVLLKKGETITRTFKVRIKENLGKVDGLKMVNIYGNKVVVAIIFPEIKKEFSITKKVRNFTLNETDFRKENQAKAGDTLEYLIEFKNNSEEPGDNILVRDTLPQFVQYLEGTTIISKSGSREKSFIDGITDKGVNIGSLAQGESGYIKFKVIISSKVAPSEVLVNTAYLKHDDKEICDTAKTIIVAKEQVIAKAAGPSLPVTGVQTIFISILSVILISSLWAYIKLRNRLKKMLKLSNI